MTLTEKYIELVQGVNHSKTATDHLTANFYLDGWIKGVKDCGIDLDILEADRFYIKQGSNRPMCCGVFLDWKPQIEAKP